MVLAVSGVFYSPVNAADNIVAGSVRLADGGMLNPVTGNWISGKTSTGRYWVDVNQTSTQAVIMVITPVDDFGAQSANNLYTTYNHDHAAGKVYIAVTDSQSGQLQDGNFSFMAFVK